MHMLSIYLYIYPSIERKYMTRISVSRVRHFAVYCCVSYVRDLCAEGVVERFPSGEIFAEFFVASWVVLGRSLK